MASWWLVGGGRGTLGRDGGPSPWCALGWRPPTVVPFPDLAGLTLSQWARFEVQGGDFYPLNGRWCLKTVETVVGRSWLQGQWPRWWKP